MWRQTPRRVVILNEMVHSARDIDLSGRPHRPSSMHFLTGDSIGPWEGNTLVVDPTNFPTEGTHIRVRLATSPPTTRWKAG